jgi:hypothetical protein
MRNHVCRVNPCAEYVLFKVNTSAESCFAELIFFPPRNYIVQCEFFCCFSAESHDLPAVNSSSDP